MKKVNIEKKFNLFEEQWSPKIVGQVNDMYIKLAKLEGEFEWHKHDDEDEMFYVFRGRLEMHFRDKIEKLDEGEFIVVPKGVDHKPAAKDEAEIVLFESKDTVNTGDNKSNRTVTDLEWI
mgnify:CR=1 FL=1|jgi:mannose-6-phosphate isomerase-like protein (cupin superfamily)